MVDAAAEALCKEDARVRLLAAIMLMTHYADHADLIPHLAGTVTGSSLDLVTLVATILMAISPVPIPNLDRAKQYQRYTEDTTLNPHQQTP